jgi:hypothetical protein
VLVRYYGVQISERLEALQKRYHRFEISLCLQSLDSPISESVKIRFVHAEQACAIRKSLRKNSNNFFSFGKWLRKEIAINSHQYYRLAEGAREIALVDPADPSKIVLYAFSLCKATIPSTP